MVSFRHLSFRHLLNCCIGNRKTDVSQPDLKNMNLWRPITDFLDDPEEDMRLQACWVLGTAVQVRLEPPLLVGISC